MARPKLLIWIIAGFCAAFLLAACVLGVAGTYRRNDKVDVVYSHDGRRTVITLEPAQREP